MLKRIYNVGYNASILFVLMFANLLVLTSILFLINIPISIFHLPISLILALIELYFIREERIKNVIISLLVFVIIFSFSCIICGRVYDDSADGNGYHKLAIGFLKNGWNPIYDSQDEYIEKLNLNTQENTWVEHYPKATWIYGASVYILTNNIETAKTFNLITLFIIFFIIAYLINKYYQKPLSAFLIAISACTFPIIWQQIFCLYLDGFMGLILLLLIIYFYLYIKNDKSKEYFIISAALMIIIINIKYTGLFYAGIFCLGYYIYYLIIKIKNKEYNDLIKTTVSFAIVLLISLLIVGSNSYVKNLITEHNPLSPIIGENKIDIVTPQQPELFADKSPIEKNFYSIFSYTANYATAFNQGTPQLKIPFTSDKNAELKMLNEDTRIGGFGIYFSGILIISILIIIIDLILSIKRAKYDKLIFIGIPLLITILLMFFFGESWWARYSPQTYFIVLMSIFILFTSNNKIYYIIGIVMFLLCCYNSGLIAKRMIDVKIPNSGQTRINLENLENKSVKLEEDGYTGVLFNLKDHGIKYSFKEKIKNKKPLYIGKLYYEAKQ